MKFPLNEKIVLFHISFESFCSRRFRFCAEMWTLTYCALHLNGEYLLFAIETTQKIEKYKSVTLFKSRELVITILIRVACVVEKKNSVMEKDYFKLRENIMQFGLWVDFHDRVTIIWYYARRAVNNLFCFIIMYADLFRMMSECDSQSFFVITFSLCWVEI